MRKVALLTPLLLVACSGGPTVTAGADAAAAGPHYSAPPAAVAAPVAGESPSVQESPTEAPSVQESPTEAPTNALKAATVKALSDDAVAAGTLSLEQRPFAGNQLVFKWTTSDNPDDAEAKDRLRTQSLAILDQARQSGLQYGSVLLMASAIVKSDAGRKSEVTAVRAKYTRALVLKTDFTKLAAADVYKICDDKPAELDPHFA
jgi:hypothetical protein